MLFKYFHKYSSDFVSISTIVLVSARTEFLRHNMILDLFFAYFSFHSRKRVWVAPTLTVSSQKETKPGSLRLINSYILHFHGISSAGFSYFGRRRMLFLSSDMSN